MPRTLSLLAIPLCLFGGALPALAQPKAPAPPEKYNVDIRYRIDAFRNERARLFLDLKQHLKSLGFERDQTDVMRGYDLNEEVNPDANRLRGTISAANARKILENQTVLTILLSPAGKQLPGQNQPVRVELELIDTGARRQRPLSDELSGILANLEFKQAIGYDRRNARRLLGSIPVGRLETLLTDVRRSPASWSLLPKSLLSDIRRYLGGRQILHVTLQEWYAKPEGKRLLGEAMTDWSLQKPAIEYQARLPKSVRDREDVVQEVLLEQFEGYPTREQLLERRRIGRAVTPEELDAADRATAIWQKLLEGVIKSSAGPVLMNGLLSRLENRDANAALPPLFRGLRVLRVIEAQPDLPLPAARPVPAAVPAELEKLTPPVRDLIRGAGQGNLLRLELILATDPEGEDWKQQLSDAARGLVIEGRVGPFVSVRCPPAQVQAVAARQLVSTIRLPRPAESAVLVLPDRGGNPAEVLKDAGLDRLHRAGKYGQKVRVAVVEADFRGWQGMVGKGLPASTRLLDLTSERNADMRPDPFPNEAGTVGNGVRLAQAVLLAASQCELLLVRVDPAAPYMLNVILRRINGEDHVSESLVQRREDLAKTRLELNERKKLLQQEREAVLKLFADDRPQLDPILKERQDRLAAYRIKQAQYETDERTYDARVKVYLAYRASLTPLRGVRIVACGLNWVDGHPVDGSGPLARYLDDVPLEKALWFQPAGNTRGQAWTGLFRDVDRNGVMEYSAPTVPLQAGSWNREMNFLAWQPARAEREERNAERGAQSAENQAMLRPRSALRAPRSTLHVPAGTRIRVSLQWTEAHDRLSVRPGEDPYRDPLANLRLLVLQQPDPEGRTRPADDLVVVAQSVGLPQRLMNRPEGAVYERTVEFTTQAAGRYAVRVEGVLPDGIEPPGTATLVSTRRMGEIRPRVFVETIVGNGRAILGSYATQPGTLGTPADSLRAITVGAINATGGVQPYSVEGAALNMEMTLRPDLRIQDRLGLAGAEDVGGTGMSAAFAAGHAAVVLHECDTPDAIRARLRGKPRKQ